MSKKTIYLVGILLVILVGMWAQYFFCCATSCEEKCNSSATANESDNSLNNDLHFLPGFNFNSNTDSFRCKDNFSFLNADYKLITPFSDSINLGIEKLKNYLNNSDAKFAIVGNYNPKEENNSIFPDLGLARATAVKNYLVTKGIDENKLVVTSVQNKKLSIADTIFSSTEFTNWIETPEEANTETSALNWNTIRDEINANPVRVYFETGQSTISLTQEQKVQIKKIIDYVTTVPNSKIVVEGHTDATAGVKMSNLEYSKNRANFLKSYLVSNGLSENKIITVGKGESMPIADNTTDEGKAKNRRAEIKIE